MIADSFDPNAIPPFPGQTRRFKNTQYAGKLAGREFTITDYTSARGPVGVFTYADPVRGPSLAAGSWEQVVDNSEYVSGWDESEHMPTADLGSGSKDSDKVRAIRRACVAVNKGWTGPKTPALNFLVEQSGLHRQSVGDMVHTLRALFLFTLQNK